MTHSPALVPHDRPASTDGGLAAFERLLAQVVEGDEQARARLWSDHYEVLRQLVVVWFLRQNTKRPGGGDLSIGPTHIVNELFLRLSDRSSAFDQGRRYLFKCFYNECARILIDHLRRTQRHHQRRVAYPSQLITPQLIGAKLDVLEGVIEELSAQDRMLADVAAMKVFESVADEKCPGGMRKIYNHEVADRLGCSLRKVEQLWAFAKSYLLDRLGER